MELNYGTAVKLNYGTTMKLNFNFVGCKGLPFVAGRAVPEEHLRFEMTVATAVHHVFLQGAPDYAAHHVGIAFPSRIEVAQAQAEQAVYTAEVGLLAHEFYGDFGCFFFAVEQQRFFVNHVDQIKLGKGLQVACEHGEAGGGFTLGVVGIIQFFAHHA